MPSAQPLAHKEASLFKQVLKLYEQKQYKKGLKTCEQILKKVPKHGETTAMKGLIINSLGRTEEAFAIAKEALKLDMRSHVCWHVYGLLYRAEKNFEESIKAYKMALRFEPDSPQILRDLALLQIQMRDYVGYIETRRTIMQQRPQLRQNWTALAVAHHLAGQYSEAEKVLSKYEETLQGNAAKWDIEHWEAALYKNRVIAESGDTERALEHLETISKHVLDKPAMLESKAAYLLTLGRMDEAEKAYRVLLDRNPENRAYYAGLEKSLGIDATNRREAKAVYDDYAAKLERNDAPRRIPLDFLEGDEFKEAADVYLRRLLEKGVPSTFANIKALYADTAKRETIFSLVSSYNDAQEKEETAETNGSTPEPSKFRIWTLYFLAQHFDHYRTRDIEKALQYLNKALELAPTQVELHMTVARVYKHAGDLKAAMDKMDEARQLDKSDRYINTKTAKYQLRNDCNEEALKTMSLFTRNEANGGPLGDLIEMQCVWFITEDAESHARQKKFGIALKRYQSLWKIFDDWTEDQFDFHSFSLRKGQIRAYIDMLKWEDTLRSHPFFARAALGAINIYLQLADNPNASNGTGPDYAAMSESERKAAKKKAKKEEQKAREAAAAAAAKQKEDRNKNAQAGDEAEKKVDTDPLGTELVKTKTPLEDATKWVGPLLEFSPDNLEAQAAGFEVYIRRSKWLLAMKCLLKARSLSLDSPTAHEMTIKMRQNINTTDLTALSPESLEVLNEELEAILPKSTDLVAHNADFLRKHADSPAHVRAGVRINHMLGVENPAEQLTVDDKIEDVVEGLRLLKELGLDTEKYVAEARERWTRATAFA